MMGGPYWSLRLFVLRVRHAFLPQKLRWKIRVPGPAFAPQAIDPSAVGVQVKHERLVALAPVQPFQRVIGQFVGDVALLRDALAIDIETVGVRQVRALPFETD